MAFQDAHARIDWRLHLHSSPDRVWEALATDAGRARFWAEAAPETDGRIHFHILGYPTFAGQIQVREPGRRFALDYFGTQVMFELFPDGAGGTDLRLTASEVGEDLKTEMTAGWVSVLLALKGAVDFNVDLRNHDATRSWQQGYVDN